jgi:pimeloyl-ACP methyl ester carboxylesterase
MRPQQLGVRILLCATLAATMATNPVVGVLQSAAQDGTWFCGAYDQTAAHGRTPATDGQGRVFPVVTIHGITGSDDDFGGTIDHSYLGSQLQPARSLFDALAGSSAVDAPPPGLEGARVFSFSYTPDSLRWVDDPAVGGKFAETIDCLHEEFGVPVSVVAHSMGGLVARWVANSTDPAGVPRASKLGKVVTLGTPYTGSDLSAVVNGVTDTAAALDWTPNLRLLNYLCGEVGTATGEGSCGLIPFYSSLRSEAGRNLRSGSDALAALQRWPSGVDVTTIAGSVSLPMMLFGSPLNTPVDLGDLVVGTPSATADPTAGRVFECSYASATGTYLTSWKEVLGIASPEDRRAKLTANLLDSPCYHGMLMRNVELTNEVLAQLTDWLASHRAPPPPESPTWEEIKDASIPGVCQHPPTTLVDGVDVTLSADQGVFELLPSLPDGRPGMVRDVPSNDAGPLTAVVVRCNAGGVGWPNSVMFFSDGGRYYGVHDLYEGIDWEGIGLSGPGRDGLQEVTLEDGQVLVFTMAEALDDPQCCPSTSASLRLRARDGRIEATEFWEEVGD